LPLADADPGRFVALARASAALHGDLVHSPKTPDEYRAYAERFAGEGAVCFVVATADDLVGFVNISDIILGAYLRGTVGYGVFAPSAGRGYMTEGLALAVEHAFGQLGLHRLEADIQPGNLASIGLVKRVGFVHEGYSRGFARINGVWRDHERYAITPEIYSEQS
jgi:ribosomal-protein-alanine N-acetyltransferase